MITTLPSGAKSKSLWVWEGKTLSSKPLLVLHQLGCPCSVCDLHREMWVCPAAPGRWDVPSQGLSAPIKQPTWQKHCHFINQQAPTACEAQCEKRHMENRWETAPKCYTHRNYLELCHSWQVTGSVLLSGVAQPPHTIQLGVSLALTLKSFLLKPKLNLSCCYSTPLISIPVHHRQKEEITLSFYVLEKYYVV